MSIPTDRLREIATKAWALNDQIDPPNWTECEPIATELLACREERDAARAEAEKLRSRLRETNQTIVECIGASGPDTSEDAAKRAVDEIEKLRGILDDTESESGLAALQVDEAVEEYPTLPDFVKHIVEERVAYGEEADALSREVESLRAKLAAVTRQRDKLLAKLPKEDEFPSWDELAMRPEIDKRFGTRVRILNAAARERHEHPDLSVRKFVFDASRLHVRNLGAACAELLKAAVENWRAEQPKPQRPEVQP